MPADRVDGTPLFGADGQRLGTLVDVVVYKPKGKIAYGVVAFGGVLGFGRRYRAIPWDLMAYDMGDQGLVTALSREDLVLAPDFDPFELGGWNDAAVRLALDKHYGPLGARPYWT